jgi:hypothetical protein
VELPVVAFEDEFPDVVVFASRIILIFGFDSKILIKF